MDECRSHRQLTQASCLQSCDDTTGISLSTGNASFFYCFACAACGTLLLWTSVNGMNLYDHHEGVDFRLMGPPSWFDVWSFVQEGHRRPFHFGAILTHSISRYIQVVLLIMHGTWRGGSRTFSHKRGIYLCALVSFVSMSHQVGCKLDTGCGREFRMSFR